MFEEQILVSSSGVTVSDVCCSREPQTWSKPEPVRHRSVVLIRSGVFRRRVGGREVVLDASVGYLPVPETEAAFAHPSGGDRCTSIAVSADHVAELVGTRRAPELIMVGTKLQLAHRALIARAASGADPDELAERAHVLVGSALAAADSVAFAASSWRVADQVRGLLGADLTRPLADLARETRLSPYHLSRVFRRATGRTISGFRIELKLRRALDQLAAGQTDLAALAMESGFSDQAHLTRLLRREAGVTPGAVRELFNRT